MPEPTGMSMLPGKSMTLKWIVFTGFYGENDNLARFIADRGDRGAAESGQRFLTVEIKCPPEMGRKEVGNLISTALETLSAKLKELEK